MYVAMADLLHYTTLNERLDAALSVSNRLVADLCEPIKDLGLSGDEHRVLLLLWEADGMPEQRIAARLHRYAVEGMLDALERKGLVERSGTDGQADVWLTREGRRVRDIVGTDEMSSRFRLLKDEIVALRDALCRTADLLPNVQMPFDTTNAFA